MTNEIYTLPLGSIEKVLYIVLSILKELFTKFKITIILIYKYISEIIPIWVKLQILIKLIEVIYLFF